MSAELIIAVRKYARLLENRDAIRDEAISPLGTILRAAGVPLPSNAEMDEARQAVIAAALAEAEQPERPNGLAV